MKMQSENQIQDQVRLPFSVALGIVLQGIRIRMGRSIVTMMGVVLGVAFLMSVLSSNFMRRGMAGETEIRQETSRMLRFLENEVGSVRGRRLAVYAPEGLTDVEIRLLRVLHREAVEVIRFYSGTEFTPPRALSSFSPQSGPEGLSADADVLILMSEPAAFTPELRAALTQGLKQPLIAWTRDGEVREYWPHVHQTRLGRVPRPEERERALMEARQERVRGIWIVSIALLVTVIGITNALLMSVTERFREIGTMKCLGALGSFIRRVFFIESALTGLVGSVLGGVLGFLVAFTMYSFTFGIGLVIASLSAPTLLLYYAASVVGGISMSILAAIYPASYASRMVPATALRSNI